MALDFIDRSLDTDSTNDETWYQRARICSQMNRTEDALDALLVSTSIFPDNKELAKDDETFSSMKNEKRFQKIVGE